MVPPKIGRLLTFLVICSVTSILADDYVVPPVRIQALWPKGVRISIPDVPGITMFCFNGNINKGILAGVEFGRIRAEVKATTAGSWSFTDASVQLKVGDVIYYYVLVETGVIQGSIFVTGHYTRTLKYTVERLEDYKSVLPTEGCKPSLTTVHQSTEPICSGQVLLEDRFLAINESLWQIEQYIPIDNPEYPFLSYQRSAVREEDGYLKIEARLQEKEPGFSDATIYSGSLDLIEGCTRAQCSKEASGADIVPPVVAGRLVSKLSFKYGVVHVRAKLPIGDWLYPEIMLEPESKKYGSRNASGVLKIAAARGNHNLTAGVKDYGNKVLYAGPVMSVECREHLLQQNIQTDEPWGDGFHTYSVRWTPDHIGLSVDDKEWGYIEPGNKTLAGRFPDKCNLSINGAKMAPFDDFFHITLGVSVGGITEFRDDVKANDRLKPWGNFNRKAMLNFWRDLNSWYHTWRQPKMVVDFVRVIAL